MSRSRYDNDFKSEVIDSGLVKEVIAIKKEYYYDTLEKVLEIESGIVYETTFDNRWSDYLLENHGNSKVCCALSLLESRRRKAKKVREKIGNIVLNNNAVFITLTFTDDVISKTSQETRRRYVARYLKSQSSEYVANIDFSPDIGREHYHAVITKRADLNAWQYGFSFAEQVRAHDRDLKRISKYITKLTAHALKVDSTRLIYSRL